MIALQWCVSFCFITEWISYTYTYIPISLPSASPSLLPGFLIPKLAVLWRSGVEGRAQQSVGACGGRLVPDSVLSLASWALLFLKPWSLELVPPGYSPDPVTSFFIFPSWGQYFLPCLQPKYLTTRRTFTTNWSFRTLPHSWKSTGLLPLLFSGRLSLRLKVVQASHL